ncbi:MAG: hypothetical protein CMH81_03835 [Nitrospiraceae bacterium]|nr:hypothetical protein [Nitrospiraceae bacterium]|tara:strand:+ start:3343 stop:3978 length:636 start_codon:yes stop_codon:yes gene_type:complete
MTLMRIFVLGLIVWFAIEGTVSAEHELSKVGPIVIANYSEFPHAWKSRNDHPAIEDLYAVHHDENGPYLKAKIGQRPQRIFKKTVWDPFTHPILTWKWRLHAMPTDNEKTVAVYVSLGTDIIGIPKIVKYLWSNTHPEGTELNEGFFRPHEVVVQSKAIPTNEWITEYVDASEDYSRFFNMDPDEKPYGIGFLVSPGVEIDFSVVVALPRE